MNLIFDPWIPVRREDGERGIIAPWQITEDIEANPIVAVASPRPDFDGALTQFLIGLLQTTCTPPDAFTWRRWRREAPTAEILRERFATVAHAFVLQADYGPLFMQERFADLSRTKNHPISYLLIGAATDSTRNQNIDLFQKRVRNSDECLCPSCAASALFTLQTFAPSGGGGGDGKFTSIRGGGPLTTIVLGRNLWETGWLNVVTGTDFITGQPGERLFPWLKLSAFISDKEPVKTVHSTDMESCHVFWGMPRRILLDLQPNNHRRPCLGCGEDVGDTACAGYWDMSGGLTYQQQVSSAKKAAWIHPRHPLSPYNEGDDKRPTAVHPQPGGIGYRHWLGLVENSADGKTQRLPAAVIEQFRSRVPEDGRIWAFGFDMDNMKARCWYDATMPLLHMDGELSAILSAHLGNMVRTARYVSGLVMSAVIKATLLDAQKKTADDGHGSYVVWRWPRDLLAKLKRTPTEKSDAIEGKVNASGEELASRVENSLLSAPMNARSQFWATTESSFFMRALELRGALLSGGDELAVLDDWRGDLAKAARSVFLSFTQVGDFDATDPRRVALAQFELDRSVEGPKCRDLLGLPQPTRSAV